MTESVSVSMLLRKGARNPTDAAKAQEIASSLGFILTGKGSATLSFRLTLKQCQDILGTDIRILPPEPSDNRDFGAPSGHEAMEACKIPDELHPFVETISVVPPARRL